MPAAALLLLALVVPAQEARPRVDCSEWQQCRQLAIDAAGRKEFETFHDLAWRAVQSGPKNDPALMYLLARAQCLSGRPADAVVMLTRLVDAGVAVDVTTNDDFEYVRALPAWPALRAKIEGASPDAASPSPGARGESPSSVIGTPRVTPAPSDKPRTAAAAGLDAIARTVETGDAVRFMTPGAAPVGIAYDAVSRRFVVADRATRKLTVVDEFTQHSATLAGAQAGFADIGALEIDPREGNLWVVSTEQGSAAAATLHKLQLISGRVLSTYAMPASLGPGRFVDVAVTPQGTVLALDAQQPRVFRLRGTALELAAKLDVASPVSLAPTDGGVLYVAHLDGLLRVDLSSGAAAAVTPPKDRSLSGLSRIRWYRGALVGIQREGDVLRVVRVTLERAGRAARAIEMIDPSSSAADAGAAAIAGDMLYYLAPSPAGEATVRKVRLK